MSFLSPSHRFCYNNIFYIHFDGTFIFHPSCNCIVNVQCTHYNVMNLFVCCLYTFQTWLSWRRILWNSERMWTKQKETKRMGNQKYTSKCAHDMLLYENAKSGVRKKQNFLFDLVCTKFYFGKSAKNICVSILSVQQNINVWLESCACVRIKESIKHLNNAQDCNK